MSFTAEPTPAFSFGNEPRMASVAGAVVIVRPTPIRTIDPTTGPQYAVSASSVEAHRNPTVIEVRALVTTRLVPKRRASRAAIGAPTAALIAKGKVCTPADSVE